MRRLPEPWRRELLSGLRSLRAGELDRAENHFARAHSRAPERPEVCFALGRERLRQRRLAEAEALLAAAWTADPTLICAAAALARCRGVFQGRFADAHAVLDDAEARAGAAEPSLAVIRGEVLLEEQRIDDARRVLESALARADAGATARQAARFALARVFNHEGIALAAAGDLDAALFAFKRAADLDPEWSGPQVNIGAAFARLRRPLRARAAYERALALDPDNPVAHFDHGLLLRDLGDRARASAALERTLALDPAHPGVRPALAELCLEAGDPARAVELCAAEVERSPGLAGPWHNLAVACAAGGDRDRAERCLRAALELDPTHPAACARLADLLARDGRYLEAAALAERARKPDPPRRS